MPLSAPRSGRNWARRPVFAHGDLPRRLFRRIRAAVSVGQLVKPVYPKDPAAPICACFGFTSEEIEADVREGVATRTRALIEAAQIVCSPLFANGGQRPIVRSGRPAIFHEVPPALTPAD